MKATAAQERGGGQGGGNAPQPRAQNLPNQNQLVKIKLILTDNFFFGCYVFL